MENKSIIVLFFLSLILSAFSISEGIKWNISPDYEVKFISENPEGIFKDLKGDINFDPNNLARSFFNMSIDVSSINTGRGMQNKHALKENWFDADNHPKITFRSVNISENSGVFMVNGKMQIKGVTKEVSFPFTFENNVFRGEFDINRLDYGIGTDKGMDKNASIMLRVELIVPVNK